MKFKSCSRCKKRKTIVPGASAKHCFECTIEVAACDSHFNSMASEVVTGLPELNFFLDKWYRVGV